MTCAAGLIDGLACVVARVTERQAGQREDNRGVVELLGAMVSSGRDCHVVLHPRYVNRQVPGHRRTKQPH